MFDARDRELMTARGVNEADIMSQIALFEKGTPYLNCERPCRPGDGITCIPESQVTHLVSAYDRICGDLHITKFVPASGAASRMFKALQGWLNQGANADSKNAEVLQFVRGLPRFAFFDLLRENLAGQGLNWEELVDRNRYAELIAPLLAPNGLNLAGLPKGLLPFHTRLGQPCTPVEEHLVEAAQYGRGKGNRCHVHFTVSQQHLHDFDRLCERMIPEYQEQFSCEYDISFSVQDPKTDTIAVDLDNRPFRNPDGSLEFRPGGHGALIENLNALETDLVFIKNIDNCVPDRLKQPTVLWKKVLAGFLLQKQQISFQMIRRLQEQEPDPSVLDETRMFANRNLHIPLEEGFEKRSLGAQKTELLRLLDRPIRVCGMVRNQGEPGGGPFWVRGSDGRLSRQIVEGAQIDQDNPAQQEVVDQATHFNPVDLVCGVRDFRGRKFDLHQYIDEDAVFISVKSKNGKPLKALERPGLWNGAMSNWLTLFVEVPMITFNPVKTVLDLLRPQHQYGS